MRGSLAFAAILVAVGLSAVGNVFASSVATMFPAVFLSTMVGLWLSHEVHSHCQQTRPFFLLQLKLFHHQFKTISPTVQAQLTKPCRWQFPAVPSAQLCSDHCLFRG
jgi:hypothetical protein